MECRCLKMSKENEMHSSLRDVSFVALLVFIGLFLSSCSEPESIDCPYGHICPGNMVCAANQAVCLPKTEGSICGDGKKESDEECDDGNILDGDGCSFNCEEERCGNGLIGREKYIKDKDDEYIFINEPIFEEVGGVRNPIEGEIELCDHGNDPEKIGITCSEDCTTNYLCGNGKNDEDGECDHGVEKVKEYFETMRDNDGFVPEFVEENGVLIPNSSHINQIVKDPNINWKGCVPDCSREIGCGNGLLDNYASLEEKSEVCDGELFDVEVNLRLLNTFSAKRLEAGQVLFYEKDGYPVVLNDSSKLYCSTGEGGCDEDEKKLIKDAVSLYVQENKIECSVDNFESSEGEYCVQSALELSSENQKVLLQDFLKTNAICNNCLSISFCGDGSKNLMRNEKGEAVEEECDPGWVGQGTTTCLESCQRSICGDGIVNEGGGEECDHGLGRDSANNNKEFDKEYVESAVGVKEVLYGDNKGKVFDGSCTNLCLKNTFGDGFKGTVVNEDGERIEEECDDGRDTEECDKKDSTSNACGDGYVNPTTEECDHGLGIKASQETVQQAVRDGKNGDEASASCTDYCKRNVAGDGFIGFGEDCDDGSAGSATCTPKARTNVCGDGHWWKDGGQEECDHGVGVGATADEVREKTNGYCTHDCKINVLGDYFIGLGEECDDGPYGSELCTTEGRKSSCGDRIVNALAGEDCDEGGVNDTTTIPMSVALEQYCQKLGKDGKTEDEGPFGNPEYSFCLYDGEKWSVNVYNNDGEQDGMIKRRAGAEYHYNVAILERKVLSGVCSGYENACKKVECGNGRIDIGEVCDGTIDALGKDKDETGAEIWKSLPAGLTCSIDCRSTQICGNGIVDSVKTNDTQSEVCEPPSDDCNACTSGKTCGNGTI